MEEHEAGAALDAAATLPTLQVGADDEIGWADLADLTLTERRRMKNRPHMQRKRAQATGNGIQENTTRLEPGPHPRSRHRGRRAGAGVGHEGESDQSDAEDEPLGKEGGKGKLDRDEGQALRRRLRHLRNTG